MKRLIAILLFAFVLGVWVVPCGAETMVLYGENYKQTIIPSTYKSELDIGEGGNYIEIPSFPEHLEIQYVEISFRVYNPRDIYDITELYIEKDGIRHDLFPPVRAESRAIRIHTFDGKCPSGYWFMGLKDEEYHWNNATASEEPSYSAISSWTISISAKTISKPSASVLISPRDGAVDIPISGQKFSWESETGAQTFDIYIWEDSAVPPASPVGAGLEDGTYIHTGTFTPSTVYHWIVSGTNVAGTEYSEEYTFTTDDGKPGIPRAVSPIGGDAWVGFNPLIQWSAAALATSFKLYLWKSADPVPTASLHEGLDPSFLISASLDADTDYSWKVEAINSFGATPGPTSAFTTARTFTDWIADFGFSPADAAPDADPDGDGLENQDEYLYPTSAALADTDGDGHSDFVEVNSGWNPLDPKSPGSHETLEGSCAFSRNPESGVWFSLLMGIAALFMFIVPRRG